MTAHPPSSSRPAPRRAAVAAAAALVALAAGRSPAVPAHGQGGPIVARLHLPLALRGRLPAGPVATAPPPTATTAASPTTGPTATPTASPTPRPKGVPGCAQPRGDRGGLRFSRDGGRTLSPGAQPLARVAYTWAVEVDPRDADRLLELHAGEVFASDDAGCTLRPTRLPALDAEATGLTRAPSDPNVVVVHSVFGRQIAVSEDGGGSWAVDAVPDDVVAWAIAPDDPWRWTFVGREGLWRREGRGAKWDSRPVGDDDAALGGVVNTAASAPGRWGTWLVGGLDGLIRTTDDGATWDRVDAALRADGVGTPPQPVVAVVGVHVTYAPGDADVAYAAVNRVARDPSQRSIWRSSDGGVTWQPRVVAGQAVADDGGGTRPAVMTGATRVFVSPHDPDVALFAFGQHTGAYGTDLFRSDDGLETLAAAHFDGFYEIFALAWGPAGSGVLFVGASSDVPGWAASDGGRAAWCDVPAAAGVRE